MNPTMTGNRRKLRVSAQPNVTLSAAHVPWNCRRARTIVLGPLTADDVDVASFLQAGWPGRRAPIALMAQGLQRALEPGTGRVMSHKQPSEQLTVGLGGCFCSVVTFLPLAGRAAPWCDSVSVRRGDRPVVGWHAGKPVSPGCPNHCHSWGAGR